MNTKEFQPNPGDIINVNDDDNFSIQRWRKFKRIEDGRFVCVTNNINSDNETVWTYAEPMSIKGPFPVDPKLEDVKVGDKVYSLMEGWVDVEDVEEDLSAIYIYTGKWCYLTNGFLNNEDKYPVLFTYNPYNPSDKPFIPKVGQIVWAWREGCIKKSIRKFLRIDKDKFICAYAPYPIECSWDYVEPLSDEEIGVSK